MAQLRSAFLSALVVFTLSAPAPAQTFRVLVTNDDGVGADGLAKLVDELKLNPNLDVTVVAPLTQQSGTGDQRTLPPFIGTATLDVDSALTATGVAATSVDGFPADCVLFGLLSLLPPQVPDIVVSGINFGVNVTREVAELSGTIGAALTAARRGIPAIAVSQDLNAAVIDDYGPAARYTARLVEQIRLKPGFLKKFTSKNLDNKIVLSVNFPTCAARGVALLPLGAQRTVTGYTLNDPGPPAVYEVMASGSALPIFTGNCASTLEDPTTDLEALTNGFATVTPLNADLTVDSKVKRFKFATQIPFD